jgi:hypothetical protein
MVVALLTVYDYGSRTSVHFVGRNFNLTLIASININFSVESWKLFERFTCCKHVLPLHHNNKDKWNNHGARIGVQARNDPVLVQSDKQGGGRPLALRYIH